MTEDVKFSGFSAVPADYECADGELAYSLGLINEDSSLNGIQSPEVVLKNIADGHEVVLIQSVATQKNVIVLSGDRNATFYLSWMPLTTDATSTADVQSISTGSNLNGFRSIAIVGNTIAVATSRGVFYILWKDGDYKYLGNKPPFLPIRFGAYKVGALNAATSTTYADVPRHTWTLYSGVKNTAAVPWSEEDTDFWAGVSNQVLGLLLGEVADKVTYNGHFYQPFYVRYAYRLYDGSHSWHSAPILLLVSTVRPVIKMSFANVGDRSLTVGCSLDNIPYFGLSHRICGEIAQLKDWSDIVAGIDVYITAPIYTFKQDVGRPNIGNATPTSLFNYYGGVYTGRPNRHDSSSGSGSDENTVLLGHYADSIDGAYKDRYMNLDINEARDWVFNLPADDNFNHRIVSESLFYKIASIDVGELRVMDTMKPLPLLQADLTNITTLPRLDDDYNSHAAILPGLIHTYNQRLLMGDIAIMPPKPFPMMAYVQAADKTSAQDEITPVNGTEKIRVFTFVNGVRCVSEYIRPVTQNTGDFGLYPYADCFPRYIYHPDPQAYKMELTTASGKFYSLPLKPHSFLNGAYWFGEFGKSPANVFDDKDPTTTTSTAVANKIYISEVNNPFVFPVANIVTIGVGRIFMLSSAAKALSQGQFGQFPLYAFTDEGIWALEVSATGVISARQPITRDVCISPESITQIDSAVLFPTARGLMLISGSQTQCISEALNSDTPFDVLSLPLIDELHGKLGHTDSTCLPVQPFTDFLTGCSMIYDYPHQRIIIYNKAYTYAYVFSLKSKLWGMMECGIRYNVNSYPEAYSVTTDGRMVNFASAIGKPGLGLFVTRPIKLGQGSLLKTIDTIILRGNFSRGHVATVLYGSRDLINWHLVWSSKDHYLRGFRGTPYKFFRIAGVANLNANENIIGASVQFTPRLTNQPR